MELLDRLTLEKKREIARRVEEQFIGPQRWTKGAWGVDVAGDPLDIEDMARKPGTFFCQCLGASVRIQTAFVMGEDPLNLGPFQGAMAALYLNAIGMELVPREDSEFESEGAYEEWQALDQLSDWNDARMRAFSDIQNVCALVVENLERENPA